MPIWTGSGGDSGKQSVLDFTAPINIACITTINSTIVTTTDTSLLKKYMSIVDDGVPPYSVIPQYAYIEEILSPTQFRLSIPALANDVALNVVINDRFNHPNFDPSDPYNFEEVVRVVLVGAGGGGSGGAYSSSSIATYSGGQGGGGGEVIDREIMIIDSEIPILLGTGGVKGIYVINVRSNAGNGGNSFFGSYLEAEGGFGGRTGVPQVNQGLAVHFDGGLGGGAGGAFNIGTGGINASGGTGLASRYGAGGGFGSMSSYCLLNNYTVTLPKGINRGVARGGDCAGYGKGGDNGDYGYGGASSGGGGGSFFKGGDGATSILNATTYLHPIYGPYGGGGGGGGRYLAVPSSFCDGADGSQGFCRIYFNVPY